VGRAEAITFSGRSEFVFVVRGSFSVVIAPVPSLFSSCFFC